ncbi:2TM domain-containing protein [Salegentibacter sediminis]|uniref:2TM domain-containing protein n=1 Tax=Salegentibacter sediminis TaxID=1930251 RepID=UPI0009C08AB8|nr:2TM domain-containing protein [Salegentibacter sediminis]
MKLLQKILKVSLAICVLVIILELIFSNQDFDKLINYRTWGIYFFYSLVLTAINAAYFSFFNAKIGWKNAGVKRVLFASAGSIILTLIGFFFCRMVDFTVFRSVEFTEFLANERLRFYLLPLLFTTIISLFFHVVYFYKALQEEKITEQKIIAGSASAKFESLKNQLDPHFLFNSLNVLSSLIEENPEKAQKFTGSLSKVYRYVLEQKDKELVSLKEELEFSRVYMKLLHMRFENSIHFEIDENFTSEEAKIVPLSLQLLLENAVKHNIASESRPLIIKIYEEQGHLIVKNNLQIKETLHQREGVGLENIINRYGLVTKRKIFIEKDRDTFTVKLPILTKQLSIMETDQMQHENAYFKAKERVKEIKEFYSNLISYMVVIPFLIFINYYTYWEFKWFWFPLFGWGLGLTIHGFSVFGYGAAWQERKIREIMEKESQNKTWN